MPSSSQEVKCDPSWPPASLGGPRSTYFLPHLARMTTYYGRMKYMKVQFQHQDAAQLSTTALARNLRLANSNNTLSVAARRIVKALRTHHRQPVPNWQTPSTLR